MKRKPYIKPTLTTIPLEGAESICLGSGGHQDWHQQIGGGKSEESILGGNTDTGGSGSGSAPDAGSDDFIWID